MKLKETDLLKFFNDQISHWPLACANHRSCKKAEIKDAEIGGLPVKIHYLPDRVISTKANLDPKAIAERPCCFCTENRPKEQRALAFDGRKGKKYDILVNPYPIYDPHFVVAEHHHNPQTITGKYVDLLDLAGAFPAVTFFYNGPRSGATIPDHHHFQACPQGKMPLEIALKEAFEARAHEKPNPLTRIIKMLDARLYHFDIYLPGIFAIRSKTIKSAAKLFYRLLDCAPMPKDPGETEPRFNLTSFMYGGEYVSLIVFRSTHRSHHYYESPDSPDYLAMSPGCADMMGDIVMISQKDFDEFPLAKVESMLKEVAISKSKEQKIIDRFTRTQPTIEVPLTQGPQILFEVIADGAGKRLAKAENGKVLYCGAYYDELYFEAQSQDRMFARESFYIDDLMFPGALRITASGNALHASNVLGLEDYLLSCISTEYAAETPLEELKTICRQARTKVLADNFIFPQYTGVTTPAHNNALRAIDATWGKTE